MASGFKLRFRFHGLKNIVRIEWKENQTRNGSWVSVRVGMGIAM